MGVDLEPSGGESNAIYGHTLEVSGKPEECLAYINKALRLQPFPNPWYPWLQGRCLRQLGRYDEATAAIKRAIALSPSVVFIRAYLVETYVAAGRLEEARAEAEEVLRLDPKFSVDPFVKLWDKYDDPNVVKGYAANLRKAGLK
jgi:adenylate cyclase